MEKKSFWEWYTENEKKTGSLVTPASAAKMIGVTRQYLEKIIASGRIKKNYYDDLPFIGMNEINEEIARRKEKIERENRKNLLLLKARKEKILEEIKQIQNDKIKQIEEEENPIDQNQIDDIEIKEAEEEINFLIDILEEEKRSPNLTSFNLFEEKEEEEDFGS